MPVCPVSACPLLRGQRAGVFLEQLKAQLAAAEELNAVYEAVALG